MTTTPSPCLKFSFSIISVSLAPIGSLLVLFAKTPGYASYVASISLRTPPMASSSIYMIAWAIALEVIYGGDISIDSTHLWAYSNKFDKKACKYKGECHHPKDYSDHDARWGYNKNHIFFSYKVYLIVDDKSQLPLEVKIIAANEADSPQAKPLLKEAKIKRPEIKIDSAFWALPMIAMKPTASS